MLAFRSNHAASFIAGAAVIGLGFMLASPAATSFPAGRFVFGPHPRDLITIREGTPFVVPPGKVFVALSMGANDNVAGALPVVRLRVNGIVRCSGNPISGVVLRSLSVCRVPSGFVVLSGSTVDVIDGASAPDDGRAWGYLSAESSGYSPDAVSPRLDYTVRPSAIVTVDPLTPLVVPSGKVFVLTALGVTSELGSGFEVARLYVNGVKEVTASPDLQSSKDGCSVMPVPDGVSAPAGSVVSVTGNPTPVAWGYFADV